MSEPMQIVKADAPIEMSPELLIARAIEHQVPVETMEKLLAMRRELKAEAARESFFCSLKAFQAECPTIAKSKSVKNRDGTVRYSYAPLEGIVKTVAPMLEKHGFSYRMDTQVEPGTPPFLVAVCTVHHVGGHSETSSFRVPIDGSPHMSPTQQYGSAGSYAKRYSFVNAFGLLAVDEDDDAPQAPPTPPAPRSAPARPPDWLAFQRRCLERLVSKIMASDEQLARAWKTLAVQKGWILPNEQLVDLLDAPTDLTAWPFPIDPSQSLPYNKSVVAKLFASYEAEALRLAGELLSGAGGEGAPQQATDAPRQEEPPPAPILSAENACPHCAHKTVRPSEDVEGCEVCRTCGWQWDVDTGEYHEEHWWMEMVCPIPPKGTSKAQYIEDGVMTLGQIARTDNRRFYGIVMNHQEAKSWTGRDGKVHPASKQDEEFAAACRAAVHYMETEPPDFTP